MNITSRLVTSMCKVFPTREPGPVLPGLSALRGESVSFLSERSISKTLLPSQTGIS